MFKLIKEGLPERKNGNGFRKLSHYPTEKMEGHCLECRAKVLFKGAEGVAVGELKAAFKTKVLKQGKRFSGHGWTANCPYCDGEHTVFFMCIKTTLANNHVNPSLNIRK